MLINYALCLTLSGIMNMEHDYTREVLIRRYVNKNIFIVSHASITTIPSWALDIQTSIERHLDKCSMRYNEIRETIEMNLFTDNSVNYVSL